MKTLLDSLYIAWTIGTKDILDALKNKNTLTNILVMVGMVGFFYWMGILRPFNKYVDVVVYDMGNTSLAIEAVTLANGTEYTLREAFSLQEMEQKMAFQNLGLVLPADFDQSLASNQTPTLSGYIFWVDRKKASGLEAKYSQAFSEIIGQPVQVVIGQNILIPQADVNGMPATVAQQMVYYVFMTAFMLIPFLMLEEKQTRTLDALLISPASPGQVVLGKALAGFFYILVIGGLALAMYSQYIVNWGLALAAFLEYALFAIGLGLAMGSFLKSMKQVGIWIVVLALFLVAPPLFYMESNLKAGIRAVLTWLPSSALASLFRFSCTTGATLEQLLLNLTIATVSIGLVFGLVILKIRRSDR
ncbi:MAG: ABC transporter permease [Anaerolineales bacterium]|nr:ABC transporter permease [Anaerolineales bacterium]